MKAPTVSARKHLDRHDSGPCAACSGPGEQTDRINEETARYIAERKGREALEANDKAAAELQRFQDYRKEIMAALRDARDAIFDEVSAAGDEDHPTIAAHAAICRRLTRLLTRIQEG